MKEDKHLEWIDLARSAAILGVILCHATEAIYRLKPDFMMELSLYSRFFAFLCFTTGRLSVPIFLMITGYLLLDREYTAEKYQFFLKDKCLRLLLCTWIWYGIYTVFLTLYQNEPFSLLHLLEEILFIRTVGMGHAWYLPMILGLYLIVPVLANGLKALNTRVLVIPLTVLTFYGFGFPFLNTVSKVMGRSELSAKISFGYGGVYSIYLILGHLIRKKLFRKINGYLLLFVTILSVTAGILFQMWAFGHGYTYKIWYDSPFILLGAAAVFELFSRYRGGLPKVVIGFMAEHSFGVYLIHMMVRQLIRPYISEMDIMLPHMVLFLWISVAGLTYLLTWLISTVPFVGKYILYEKNRKLL